jgi:hypothetical protein
MNKSSFNKILLLGFALIFFLSPLKLVVAVEPPQVQSTTEYNYLAPIRTPDCKQGSTDGTCESIDYGGKNAFSVYLNMMIKVIIGLGAVAAMVMIVIGGLQYMTSELISSKEAGKDRISSAIFGLLIMLGSYTILFTINPDLLRSDVVPDDLKIRVNVTDEPETGTQTKTIALSSTKGVPANVTACDASQKVAITLFGKSVEVNRGAVASLQRIDAAWRAMPPAQQYKINSIGGYNCRQVTNKPGFWSAHAYGLALDINPDQNPYGTTLKTDMPVEFRQLFLNEGWGWGGAWGSPVDPMHFSAMPNEHASVKLDL